MPTLIDTPTVIKAAGNKPKRIEEFVGKVRTNTSEVSVARIDRLGQDDLNASPKPVVKTVS